MPTRPTVAILGEFGTYGELQQACERVGAQTFVTTDLDSLRDADGMVIAGHKKSLETYEAVRKLHGDRVLGRRVAGGRPVLVAGAGFGMLFEVIRTVNPELGDLDISALGEWPGAAQDLATAGAPPGHYRVEAAASSKFLQDLPEPLNFKAEDAVFTWDFDQSIDYMEPPAVSWTDADPRYIAAVENGPLTAIQFCPVASGAAGEEFLRRWVAHLPVMNRL